MSRYLKGPARRNHFLALLGLLLAMQLANAQHMQWIVSTDGAQWKTQEAAEEERPADDTRAIAITIDGKKTFQAMDGFGGCFNELGWEALKALEPRARDQVLAALFSPQGADFKLGRVPIGANDFAKDWYSFDETPGDFALKHFSIDRDHEDVLPFIKAAMRYQPQLAVWGVPWSPPTWMKTNGAYKGGEWKQDPATLNAYALYFSKYVRAYRAEGISLFAVMPQNEPNYNDNIYPQAVVSPENLNIFVRDYLAPQLKKDDVNIEIWIGTIVKPAVPYVEASLRDPMTNPDVTGVGLQWEGQKSIESIHAEFPGKKIAQTETECYDGKNNWDQAMTTFRKMIADTQHSANSYFYWNLVLDQTGLSHWNWRQNSLITVNSTTKQVTYNPEYYALRHFSAFVKPGALRVAVEGGTLIDAVAFHNVDGSTVVLLANASKDSMEVSLTAGAKAVHLTLPPQSMNSLIER